MERERAMKTETIKPAAARVAHSRRPILALVEEGAGLLAFKQVDPESNPVLCNKKIAGHCRTNWRFVFVLFIGGLRGHGQTASLPYGGIKQTDDHRKPFELADLGVVALDDQARMEFFDQQFDPRRLQRLHSARHRLKRKTIAIAINDQTGQEVAFGVNQAVSVGIADDAPAPLGLGAQTLQPEVARDLDVVF